jgi:hypothetical protein
MEQMKDLKNAFREEMKNMQEYVAADMKEEFDDHHLGTEGFFETQMVL